MRTAKKKTAENFTNRAIALRLAAEEAAKLKKQRADIEFYARL